MFFSNKVSVGSLVSMFSNNWYHHSGLKMLNTIRSCQDPVFHSVHEEIPSW